MRTRNWAIFIVISAIVLMVLMLTASFIRDRAQLSPAPTSTFTLVAVAETTDTPTAPPAVSPTPMSPLLYTVQPGDTLGAIAQAHGVSVDDLIAANNLANPDVLSVGQTLIVPVDDFHAPTTIPPTDPLSESPTSEPFPTAMLPTSLPTLTPSGPPLVEIGQVLGCGDAVVEVVVVRNRGGMVSLEGWTLADAEGNTFTFPALTLFSDAEVCVHSTAGDSTPGDLYWGRANPAWNGGELITLRDAMGEVVDTYIAP